LSLCGITSHTSEQIDRTFVLYQEHHLLARVVLTPLLSHANVTRFRLS
jgi:hypothetical protein